VKRRTIIIEIRDGIPIPIGRSVEDSVLNTLRKTISSMKVGQHFDWKSENKSLYRAASEIDVKIKTRKLDGGGYRVWRTN
jgi:hypothetical protein